MRLNRTFRFCALATFTLLIAVSASIQAQNQDQDQAAAVFDSLYGAKLRQAKRTSSKTDDVELAAELIEGAKLSLNQKELLVLLCQNAYSMGSTSVDGYGHATEAMMLLAEHVPAQKNEAQSKILKLLERQYKSAKTKDQQQAAGQLYLVSLLQTADDFLADKNASAAIAQYAKARIVAARIKSDQRDQIKQKQAAATSLLTTFNTLKQLQAKLEANPKDEATAKRLIDIYIGDLDNLEQARQYSGQITDKALKENLSMTVEDVEDLSEDQLLAMGKWYYGFALKASSHCKASLLVRARTYYQHFLELHEDGDLSRTSAVLKLKKIDSTLAKLPGGSKLIKGRDEDIKWVDVTEVFMKVVTDKTYIQRGAKVEFNEKVLQLRGDGGGGAYIVAPINVENFVFNVKVKKISGTAVMIGGRTTGDGHYQVIMEPTGVIKMKRWVEQGGVGVELAQVTLPMEAEPKPLTLNLAVIDDIIILFIDGKRVLAAKDDAVFGKGGIIIGGTGVDVDFSDMKYMVPTEEQVKQMTAPGKK